MATITYEKQLLEKYTVIAGMDEAGRGCLAGPVVSACVVLKNPFKQVYRVADSKQVKKELREELFEKIMENSAAYKISIATPEEIDQINILKATQLSMNRAYQELEIKPEFTLVDGRFPHGFEFEHECIIKGDDKHYSIAAASILAKVFRDRMMMKLDEEYPEYGFAQHKGYGTVEHRNAIDKYGLSPIHRRTFSAQLKLF